MRGSQFALNQHIMNIHLPDVMCSIPLNRGECEDFINNYHKGERPSWAAGCEIPLKAIINKNVVHTTFIVLCTWEETTEKLKIVHITSLS